MLKIDRRMLEHFDWITFCIVLFICIIGILTIYSATRPPLDEGESPPFYIKQLIWLLIAIMTLVIFVTFDYVKIKKYWLILYIIGISLLIIVLFMGKTAMGAKRWINLGFFSFQPSEIFKIIFIISISAFLENKESPLSAKDTLKTLIIFGIIPFLLIMKQPDLGTAILILTITIIMIIYKGLTIRLLILFLSLCITSIVFLWEILWAGLKEYQKNRLIAFIDPSIDPRGIGYNIMQSVITVGSGGLFGKGFLEGTQGPLKFLPERHTDFIFPIFSEEWGFIGCLILLALYFTVFIRCFQTSVIAKNSFGKLLAIGFTSIFVLYFFINIGMTLGIMPVVGIPLPFMSYGGTTLLANFTGIALVINVRMRRFELFYP
ncbi:MAG TPA: rod shape-determining protein RodA [Thermodesulfovibrio thiophilus]|uniref:rod shape-determining protein RodA n=1 Tax=Thermodesulfovibrio thiophilus TaxID=340095 RepID=UPI0017FE120F|nr:rod shape-determining protein RodA [Thermodesulfovibrio thiophilus]HHW20599.1 rod shape-determining protein RodA [Thermodesulfovibrio thiophilus]HOA83073.1 rod shape-determining protein RodA [Thermodesulfovibrio thiophilus]HQA03274.1 rod shape-determining protein RodA [Thermodesulfovibrio thiophilus]HQD36148.1 rod shape-determining protein RodA [Thermodesulfovibrio thiophilus]